jgi:hypothetical protein
MEIWCGASSAGLKIILITIPQFGYSYLCRHLNSVVSDVRGHFPVSLSITLHPHVTLSIEMVCASAHRGVVRGSRLGLVMVIRD